MYFKICSLPARRKHLYFLVRFLGSSLQLSCPSTFIFDFFQKKNGKSVSLLKVRTVSCFYFEFWTNILFRSKSSLIWLFDGTIINTSWYHYIMILSVLDHQTDKERIIYIAIYDHNILISCVVFVWCYNFLFYLRFKFLKWNLHNVGVPCNVI